MHVGSWRLGGVAGDDLALFDELLYVEDVIKAALLGAVLAVAPRARLAVQAFALLDRLRIADGGIRRVGRSSHTWWKAMSARQE